MPKLFNANNLRFFFTNLIKLYHISFWCVEVITSIISLAIFGKNQYTFLALVIGVVILFILICKDYASVTFLKIVASIYPGLAAVIILFFRGQIFTNTNIGVNFIRESLSLDFDPELIDHSRFIYEVDYLTTIYLISIIGWIFIYFFFVSNESASNAKKNEDIKSAIIRAPNFNAFISARGHIDKVFSKIGQLRKLEAEFDLTNFSNSRELISLLKLINLYLIKMAANFFNNKNIVGGNFMILFGTSQEELEAIEKLKEESQVLYDRGTNFHSDIEGYLYLAPYLFASDDMPSHFYPSLIIPLYKNTSRVYAKAGTFDDDLCVIPGATLAYFEGTSMVGDTWDTEKYYKNLNDETVKEVNTFFHGNGKSVRSFTSFLVPHLTDVDLGVGIYNIDSPKPNSFGDKEFFSTFYTMIYPTLKIVSNSINAYKRYLINQLTSR
jgi:hypothetical protein